MRVALVGAPADRARARKRGLMLILHDLQAIHWAFAGLGIAFVTVALLAIALLLIAGCGGSGSAPKHQPQSPITVDWLPWSVAIGDVNGDGRNDVMMTSYFDSTLTILLQQ